MSSIKALAGVLVLGTAPLLAGAQPFMPTPDAPVTVETCVQGDHYELHAGSDSALLDEDDRLGVQAALLERYPAFGRDGLSISAIVLWHKPETGWVFLALRTHPDKPGRVCSAASFSAGAFGFSAELQRKYFVGTRS